MAVNKTINYGLNKPDKNTRNWDAFLRENADLVDQLLKVLADGGAELGNRVNNIVAHAGDANTEIVDARLGADGNARANLGTLIREIHTRTLQPQSKLTAEFEAHSYKLGAAAAVADTGAESGTAASITPSGSLAAFDAVIAETAGLRFSRYSVGFRLKTADNAAAATVATIYFEQYNDTLQTPAWEVIDSYIIGATDFDNNTAYQMFYLGGDYKAGSKVRARINASDAVAFKADSIIITPAGKAVV